MSQLHTFKLADTKVGDEGVRKAVKGLPGLKTLHLFSNQQLTDACCEDIGRLEFLKVRSKVTKGKAPLY